MSAMSDYLERELRKHLFRTGSFAKPSALYIALYTAPPSDAGGGTEVSGGNYQRAQLNPSDANWTAASPTDGVTTNAVPITFPVPTVAWGTITHFGILDAATAGNLLFHAALDFPRIVNAGDVAPQFATGALIVTFQ